MNPLKEFPFYQLAHDMWEKTQQTQIVKGLHKYEEAFNPASWTGDELMEHALQESVDLVHYLVGLGAKVKAQEQEIAFLKAQLTIQEHYVQKLLNKTEKPSYLNLT